MMEKKLERMKELLALLKAEDEAYYLRDNPIVTDREWDAQFDELAALEKETGIIFASSPTQNVSGKPQDSLAKVAHSKPMLSAAKTKDPMDIDAFSKKGRCPCVVSWKEDGLTLVLRYSGGVFTSAITRGDGTTGEDVTHNIRCVHGVPKPIPYSGDLEVRGECVISWTDFDAVNQRVDEPYSHPRNLASGSIRLLDYKETRKRSLQFIAFELVSPMKETVVDSYEFMTQMGFNVVGHVLTPVPVVYLNSPEFDPKNYPFPVDGLIVEYNNKEYGRSLGATGHHENCRMAFKWQDEEYSTVFTGLVIRPTRTGILSLTATFKPTKIDGATVRRATLHNVDYCFVKPKTPQQGKDVSAWFWHRW